MAIVLVQIKAKGWSYINWNWDFHWYSLLGVSPFSLSLLCFSRNKNRKNYNIRNAQNYHQNIGPILECHTCAPELHVMSDPNIVLENN